MPVARVLSSLAASAAVAGCAVLVVGMSRSADQPRSERRAPVAAQTSRPAFLPATDVAADPATPAPSHRTSPAPASSPATSSVPPTVATPALTSPVPVRTSTDASTPAKTPATTPAKTPATTPAASTPAPRPAPAARPARTRSTSTPRTSAPVRRPAPRPAPTHATPHASALPLRFSTGSATEVITVTAPSHSSTTARLQAWTKVPGGWRRHGSAVSAHVGADGLSTHASESRSATPIGSFTVTHAFGHDSDPGTALPYTHTTPSYWWISEAGRLYNTMQHCSSGCSFNQGSPNEHLYYETPYYNYAAVIDYNTRNAPGGVHQGRGSAFFLHVSVGEPTAGCVSIPESRLVPLLRWLTPSAHPRILIGVT